MAGEIGALKFVPRLLEMAESKFGGKMAAELAEKGLLTLAKSETVLTKVATLTGDVIKTDGNVVAKGLIPANGKFLSKGTTAVEKALIGSKNESTILGKVFTKKPPRAPYFGNGGGGKIDYVPKPSKFVEIRAKVTGLPELKYSKNSRTWHQDINIQILEVIKPLPGKVVPNVASGIAKTGAVGGQIMEGAGKGLGSGVSGGVKPGMYLTVNHNIDLAEQVPLKLGDEIIVRARPMSFGGRKIQGLHWTHKAWNLNDAGFIKVLRLGKIFQ